MGLLGGAAEEGGKLGGWGWRRDQMGRSPTRTLNVSRPGAATAFSGRAFRSAWSWGTVGRERFSCRQFRRLGFGKCCRADSGSFELVS